MERDKFLSEKIKAEEYLEKAPQEFAEHMKIAHNGVVASACHKCISFKAGIRSNTWFLRDLEKGVFDQKPGDEPAATNKITAG